MKSIKEKKYRQESEYDLAIKYLEELNKKINYLQNISIKFRIKQLFSSNQNKIIKHLTIKSHKYLKDGYEFQTKIEKMYESKEEHPHYCVYLNIKVGMEQRKKLLYKEFSYLKDASNYFKILNQEIENSKRRDIMEKIFDIKIKEIKKIL